MMFGYACDETTELMPLPIMTAHKLAKRLADVRKKGTLDFLRPDGKSQVTVRYDADNPPAAIDTVVVSTQHSESVKYKTLQEPAMDEVIPPLLPAGDAPGEAHVFLHRTGAVCVV